MWWLIGSAPDFWGRGPGFESGIYHNDPDALQDHCVILSKISGKRGEPPPEAKKIYKKKGNTWLVLGFSYAWNSTKYEYKIRKIQKQQYIRGSFFNRIIKLFKLKFKLNWEMWSIVVAHWLQVSLVGIVIWAYKRIPISDLNCVLHKKTYYYFYSSFLMKDFL